MAIKTNGAVFCAPFILLRILLSAPFGLVLIPTLGAYSATKHAVIGLTKTIAGWIVVLVPRTKCNKSSEDAGGFELNNIFIEGIQGSGKSTLINLLQKKLPEYKAYREGEISPVELAWCSYMTSQQYKEVCIRYQDIVSDLENHTFTEGNRKITAYTQILTDIQGFHKFMEQFEIYNGKVGFNKFKDVIFKRYKSFQGSGNIFECSFFQNSIECMMLYYQMCDKDIRDFYREAYDILRSKDFRLLYLDVEDMEANIATIKEERVDTQGNELWYQLILQFLSESPYGKAHNLKDIDGLIYHLKKRRELEHSVIEAIGKDALIIVSKKYEIDKVVNWCIQ